MSESAEAVRERRRLKILNKSEERMKKLLGHSTSEQNSLQLDSSSNDVHMFNSFCATNCDVGHEKTNALQVGSEFIDAADIATPNDRISSLPNGQSYISSSSHVSSSSISSATASDEDETTVPCETEDQSGHWLFRNSLLMFFGIIVRLVLLTEFGRQIVQTIFNPFMTIEVVIFGFERTLGKDWNENVSGALGRIWLIAFQLTGMNADLIKTYKRAVSLVTSIFQDFMFYFFAFVLTHLLLAL